MNILKEVLSLPTAPFYEDMVSLYVRGFASDLGLKIKSDRAGNLLIHYKKGPVKQPVVFAVHMDHPGFVVLSSKKGLSEVGILGGVNLDHFLKASVKIKTKNDLIKGKVVKKIAGKKWQNKPVFQIKTKKDVKRGDFGWFDLVPFKLEKNIVYTKAADNLVSVTALLDLLSHLVSKKIKADVRCLFTRAEEVGFVGCIAFSKEKIIPKNIPIVVLECSSAKAGKVEIGGGPIIRVGDKLSSYSSKVDCWLKRTANQFAKKNKTFKFQRALLGGGTCEASIWNILNMPTGGLAFPLGNYHNNAGKTYGPEYVSIEDYKLMQSFLVEIVKSEKFTDSIKKDAAAIYKNYELWENFFKKRP